MSIITFSEIVDIFVMAVVVAYIFSDVVRNGSSKKQAFFDALIIASPAIILHEGAHKVVALLSGFDASFHASYIFLAIGVLLKLLNAGFIFFIPGYVSFSCGTNCAPFLLGATAFAGPAMNGLLYLGARWYAPRVTGRKRMLSLGVRRINGFLFLFNMLPIPGFDGFSVYRALWGMM